MSPRNLIKHLCRRSLVAFENVSDTATGRRPSSPLHGGFEDMSTSPDVDVLVIRSAESARGQPGASSAGLALRTPPPETTMAAECSCRQRPTERRHGGCWTGFSPARKLDPLGNFSQVWSDRRRLQFC